MRNIVYTLTAGVTIVGLLFLALLYFKERHMSSTNQKVIELAANCSDGNEYAVLTNEDGTSFAVTKSKDGTPYLIFYRKPQEDVLVTKILEQVGDIPTLEVERALQDRPSHLYHEATRTIVVPVPLCK